MREKANAFRKTPLGRFNRLKEDSKKRNIDLSISLEEFKLLINKNCFYCDNNLGLKTIYGVGLDRLDNTKGYTLDNVVPCCNFCNIVKGYLLTSDEMKKVANLLINARKDLSPIDSINLKKSLTKSRKDS